jgi:magnesium chelatase subunit D
MSSFPGLQDPFLALTLTAVLPDLKGVLIAGPSGTGKSVIARLAKSLFPAGSPFVNVPLGCSLDRLVGGIDLERTQRTGKLVATQGLLSRAHGGVLYIDEINLLSSELSAVVMQAVMQEKVQIEREGASYTYPAKFTLLGTFNPAEKELPIAFYDRLSFLVFSETIGHLGWRMFVAARQQKGLSIPDDVIARVKKARKILPLVTITDKQLNELCKYATDMGVEGNRAEVLAVRCAKANAALNLRVPVTHEDVFLAIRLIFMPRLGNHALADSEFSKQSNTPDVQGEESKKSDRKLAEGDDGQQKEGEKPMVIDQESTETKGQGSKKEVALEDILPEQNDDEFPITDLPKFSGRVTRKSKAGKHHLAKSDHRGRHVRSVPGLPSEGKIDLVATLKSAAMHMSAAEKERNLSQKINIRQQDFHIKKFQQRAGLLFVLAVDGSGSMAINHFEAAKGAALQLLEKAYVYRDQVALIYFRGKQAQILVPPGSSVTQAAAALKKVNAGGKTPLASALLSTLDLVKKNNAQTSSTSTVLVLFTDGKANQPLLEIEGADLAVTALKELKPLCNTLQDQLSATIVFDTRAGRRENPFGMELAEMLSASYIRLPKATVQEVVDVIGSKSKIIR